MPMNKDEDYGTNADGTASDKYCHFCYQDGRFTDEGISMEKKIDKLVEIAVSQMQIPEKKARAIAEDLIPRLGRWRKP
ncbi:MAG: zinc ribbon domain-containing protein [candidate division WOR-3 bacterium]|nr:MAG: zinc ribbon domain-containing protein [candidate division WOR-3 bacterium]